MFKIITAAVQALQARWTGEADDAAARARGWEIEYGPRGRRTYRDPRVRNLHVADEAPAADELLHTGRGWER
jgi:hypothetical protein